MYMYSVIPIYCQVTLIFIDTKCNRRFISYLYLIPYYDVGSSSTIYAYNACQIDIVPKLFWPQLCNASIGHTSISLPPAILACAKILPVSKQHPL